MLRPSRPIRRVIAVSALALASLSLAASAQAAIVGTTDANVLGSAISAFGPVSGATLDTAPSQTCPAGPCANAVENSPLAGMPTNGSTFAIMTSGDATLADTPNDSGSSGYAWNYQVPSRGTAAFDPSTLAIPVSVPSSANCLVFDYKFFSEEFPEFVGSPFNDAFVAELDTTNWAVNSDGSLSSPNDFAGRGTQVSINGIGPNAVTPEAAAGTTYDAASNLLTTKTPVTPGAHTLYLSIFDASDAIYDSAVFVDNLHFTSEPGTACHPPDIFQGQAGAGVTGSSFKAKNNSTVLIPVLCGLPTNATINCEDNVGISAPKNALGRASISKLVSVAKPKHASIPPGGTVKVKLKLSKKAQKALAKKGKLKGKVIVTNTYNGAQAGFKATIKGKKKH
jgi:hypothetical protein